MKKSVNTADNARVKVIGIVAIIVVIAITIVLLMSNKQQEKVGVYMDITFSSTASDESIEKILSELKEYGKAEQKSGENELKAYEIKLKSDSLSDAKQLKIKLGEKSEIIGIVITEYKPNKD